MSASWKRSVWRGSLVRARRCRRSWPSCGNVAESIMTNSLSEQFRRGDRRALAQWLTAAARGQDVEALLSQIKPREKPSRVVAITGGAGVGKSTLIGRL